MIRKILIIGFLLISIAVNAQEKWEFANSTPYETVKTHFYFLDKDHYNIKLATYVLGDIKMGTKTKELNVIKLETILQKMHLRIDDVPNRRKGIVNKNKYQFFPKEPRLYLERVNRKWVYSEATIKAIPQLYSKYVLGIKDVKTPKSAPVNNIITKMVQADTNGVQFSLATPANTVKSHLIFLSDSFFNPELASQTINFAPEDTADAEELALMLKQIYLGAGRQVFSYEDLSNDTNYLDSNGAAIYHLNPDFRELYLEKIGDNWLYSRNTSKLIRSVHEDMYAGSAEDVFKFSDRFKRWAGVKNSMVIGKVLKLWQIYMLLYFVILILGLYLLNKIIIKRIFNHFFKNSPYRTISFQLFATISFSILFYIIRNYAPSIELSVQYNYIFIKTIGLSIIFTNTLLAIYVVNWFKIAFTIGHNHDSRFGIVLFTSLIVKTIIFTASILFVVDLLEFNLVNFLAGLSIGGFALAFGAQDTIKNFLGSLMIFADKSFRVGDWINNGTVSGTVEEIGLRSTKIRTFHNSLVTVPNSLLSDNNIDNLGQRIYRRYKTTLVLKYETPSSVIEEFTKRISESIANQPETRKDFYMVYMSDFNMYGVEVLIYTFFEVSDWNKEMKAKHDLIKTILNIKDDLHIEFAVPLVANIDK